MENSISKQELQKSLVRLDESGVIAKTIFECFLENIDNDKGISDSDRDKVKLITNGIITLVWHMCSRHAHVLNRHIESVKEIDNSPNLIKLINNLVSQFPESETTE